MTVKIDSTEVIEYLRPLVDEVNELRRKMALFEKRFPEIEWVEA